MLTRIEIENYRCFPELQVELAPLTVLIGPNNTGKSAFLNAIHALKKFDTPLKLSDYWRFDRAATIKIHAMSQDSPDGIILESERPGRPFKRRVPNWWRDRVTFVRLPSGGARCTSDGFPESVGEIPLGAEGERLASVLDFMLRRDRKRFDGVVSTLRELVPGFEDLSIETPKPQSRHLAVVMDNDLQLPGESLSVGLRHMIFFATLAYHPKAPDVILIEEPEHGVHPKRLGDIVRLLRSITNGRHCDHPAQVLLSTHSPFLLDHVNLDEDQLLIFQRNAVPDGARNAYPADEERLRVFQDEFNLGEVWYNEDEEGLIGHSAQ